MGRNITEYLGGKFKLSIPRRDELDLLDSEQVAAYLKQGNFDAVVHVAGIGVSRSSTHVGLYDSNTNMFLNLARNSGNFGRMIFLGSGAEYGKQRPIVKVKENDFGKVQPQDEYGRAKYFASEYISKHKNIVNLRLFGVFGKYEDYATRFISNAICRSLADMPIILKQDTVFDYIYVNDLARIMAYFIEHEPKKKFYNVGRGQGIELLALAKSVKELTQNPYEIEIKQQGMGKEYTCDNSELLKELGEFKFTPIEQAIKEMVDWYKKNWTKVDAEKLNFDA